MARRPPAHDTADDLAPGPGWQQLTASRSSLPSCGEFGAPFSSSSSLSEALAPAKSFEYASREPLAAAPAAPAAAVPAAAPGAGVWKKLNAPGTAAGAVPTPKLKVVFVPIVS